MRVHVCIPHYAREQSETAANPHGYGSLRAGAQFQRSLALSRCLHGLLSLQRQAEMTVLNIDQKRIDHFAANHPSLELNEFYVPIVMEHFYCHFEMEDVSVNVP